MLAHYFKAISKNCAVPNLVVVPHFMMVIKDQSLERISIVGNANSGVLVITAYRSLVSSIMRNSQNLGDTALASGPSQCTFTKRRGAWSF